MSKNGDKFSTIGGELLMVGYNLSLSSTEEPLFNFYLLFLLTRLMKKNPQQLTSKQSYNLLFFFYLNVFPTIPRWIWRSR
jgi:hypothetical protein